MTVTNPYRVMVVDDSAIIRGFLSRYLNEDPSVDVVTTANNGLVALRQLEKHDIEVVVLDIEMPEMDGMTALPKLIEQKPDVQVVMASTLTLKNAEVSLRALQLGAVDYVPKPETTRSVHANVDFRRELVEKVKAWAGRRRTKKGEDQPVDTSGNATKRSGPSFTRPTRPGAAGERASGFVSAPSRSTRTAPGFTRSAARAETPEPGQPAAFGSDAKIVLRKGTYRKPGILAIGSSTGGPQALMKFFKTFKKAPDVPVVITQHMPANFTAILATHLGQATGWPSKEGADGDLLEAGHIYVAPGGKHMVIAVEDGVYKVRLNDDPPENFCKPAVDPLYRSIASTYGERALAVVLTGMGHDGLKGAREMTRHNANVLAQDEATSVVWGMPGAVATAGLCTEVLPLEELGTTVAKRLQGGV